jgi:hypothetical protein
MFEQVQYRHQAPLVVMSQQADADLLVATLQIHGFEAFVMPSSAFPSLDFVEGRAVTVQLERFAEAAELLRELGHDPLPPPP